MLKRTASSLLALLLLAGLPLSCLAADDPRRFKIDPTPYRFDPDRGAVDLQQPVSIVSYGETVCYALLTDAEAPEDNAVPIARAVRLRDETKQLLAQATELLRQAEYNARDKEKNLSEAKESAEPDESIRLDLQTQADAARLLVRERTARLEEAAAQLDAAEKQLDALLSEDWQPVYDANAVQNATVAAQWEMGGELVARQTIEKKKIANHASARKYQYFLCVTLVDQDTTALRDLVGTVTLEGLSDETEPPAVTIESEVSHPIASRAHITEERQVFRQGNGFSGDENEKFTFSADPDGSFTVDTRSQRDLLLCVRNEFDTNMGILYPLARLRFFYGNRASFHQTGTLRISADEGSYLYRKRPDGTLIAQEAEYDADHAQFVIQTKTLDQYVISDIKLPV